MQNQACKHKKLISLSKKPKKSLFDHKPIQIKMDNILKRPKFSKCENINKEVL